MSTGFRKVETDIACVYVDDHKKNDDQRVIAKARHMLDEHNIPEKLCWRPPR